MWKDGQVVGAMAVSGLTSSEDIVLATLGVDLVKRRKAQGKASEAAFQAKSDLQRPSDRILNKHYGKDHRQFRRNHVRLAPPGFEKILQTPQFVATFGGGEANVAVAWHNSACRRPSSRFCRRKIPWPMPSSANCGGSAWILPESCAARAASASTISRAAPTNGPRK